MSWRIALLIGIFLASLSDARAQKTDLCADAIAKAIRTYPVPLELVRAVSIKEAGNRSNHTMPSAPWALNIDGIPAIQSSRISALKKVAEAYENGAKNVDVGCMQISLKHHGQIYASTPLEAAQILIDPDFNALYGTYLLARLKRDFGTWTEAVKHYHSADPARNKSYACDVAGIIAQMKGIERPKNCH